MSNELITTDASKALTIASIDDLVGMSLEEVQELDFSCVPTIVNDGDSFKVKGTFDWEVDSKNGFNAIILAAKPFHYYRCSDETNPVSGFYTYDKERLRTGAPIQTVIDKWEEEGVSYEIKDYMEVHLLVVDDGPGFNALAILNINPTSLKRFKSYVNLTLARQYKTDPWNVVTHFNLSEPLTSSNNKKFRTTEASFKGFITEELKGKL